MKWSHQPWVPWSVIVIRKQLFERNRMNEIMNEWSRAIPRGPEQLCLCFLFTWLYPWSWWEHKQSERQSGDKEDKRAPMMSCRCPIYWLLKPVSTLSISDIRANRSASLSTIFTPCPHFSLTCQFEVSIRPREGHANFTLTIDCLA